MNHKIIDSHKFMCYDPYLTFSEKEYIALKKSDGTSQYERSFSHDHLYRIGRNAFDLVFDECTQEDFDKAIEGYYSFINELKASISEKMKSGALKIKAEITGEEQDSIFSFDDAGVISIGWKLLSSSKDVEHHELMTEVFAILALHEIENTLVAMQWADDGVDMAIASAIVAADALSSALAIVHGNKKEQEARRNNAYNAALERLAKDTDGKQAAKRFVEDCWKNWQTNPERYKSQAKFAKDMLEKFPNLENQVSIENWCREWKKTLLS